MPNHWHFPWLTIRIAAVFVLLAVCPSVVRASCGDWLEGAHSSMPAEAETDSTESIFTETIAEPAPHPAPSPCRGPACEDSDDGPVPLTPTERRPQLPDELVLRSLVERLTGDAVPLRLGAETQRQRPGWPLQVDRPPEL